MNKFNMFITAVCVLFLIKRQILFIVKQMSVFVLHLTHIDVVAFKKKKRAEERAKESQKATEKNYEDYAWRDLCEHSTN